MVKSRTIICMSLLLLCLAPMAAFAARVQAVADRDRMNIGEGLHLELRVEGDTDRDPDLSVLDKDWEVLDRSQSSRIQIANGDFSRSVVYSLTLMPRREGEVPIPSICFGSDCSMPLPIRVKAADDATAPQQNSKLLLEAEVEPEHVVIQQQILYKVRLLHRVDLMKGSLSDPQPTGVEAVVQKLGDDRKFQTRRGGRLYQVIERDYAIFPQAAGTLRIPPLQFDGVTAGASSRFDPFGRRGERVRRHAPALQVEVTPPPADRAGRPWLPASALRLNDDWQGKTVQLTVGEPATRTLTVEAEGLQAAQLPDLQVDAPDGFKVYPDRPDREDHSDNTGITGVLQQKIALVPTRPGNYRLPAIEFAWWDVTARQWRQARFEPVDIEVRPTPGNVGATPPGIASSPDVPTAPPMETGAVSPATQSPPAASASTENTQGEKPSGFWPWLSLGLGLGWLATLLLWRQRAGRSRRAAEPVEAPPAVREKTTRRAVMQAARSNDPQATRRALAAWSAILQAPGVQSGLEGLCRAAPAPVREAVEELNRTLYAPGNHSWSGADLVEALQQWRPGEEDSADRDPLPDLYP